MPRVDATVQQTARIAAAAFSVPAIVFLLVAWDVIPPLKVLSTTMGLALVLAPVLAALPAGLRGGGVQHPLVVVGVGIAIFGGAAAFHSLTQPSRIDRKMGLSIVAWVLLGWALATAGVAFASWGAGRALGRWKARG